MHPVRKIDALLALGLFVIGMSALASLASGAPCLDIALPGGLPVGNVPPALGLCAMPASGAVIAHRRLMRRIALAALIAAIAWLPVSIAMAGNLRLVFSGARGDAWIAWSASVAILSFVVFVLAVLQRLALGIRSRRVRMLRGR